MGYVNRWNTDDDRWNAVVNRDKTADGHFLIGVKTTGIYGFPSAVSRLPKRENVVFFKTTNEAEENGYRPSKKIQSLTCPTTANHADKIVKACRYIEDNPGCATLSNVADHVGLSTYHFHRVFKLHTGLTPKEYASAQLRQRLGSSLKTNDTVTNAIYDAGFNSNSRFYETSTALLGMKPQEWRSGGMGTRIHFAIGICYLGNILVAQSDSGICAIFLGDDPNSLVMDLQDCFKNAELIGGDKNFETVMSQVVGFVENPEIGINLPLDIRGTVFQQRVWQALREIPVGQTVSYTDIALKIGSPKSVRAVAGACARNVLAIAIPCHRVVKHDGGLSGYKWGVERKKSILDREAKCI